jgi:hypothetical protein
MAAVPTKGSKVTWNTPQGPTQGEVVKTVTSVTQLRGHVAKASKAHPEVLVQSGKSGKRAIHKPEHLKKT